MPAVYLTVGAVSSILLFAGKVEGGIGKKIVLWIASGVSTAEGSVRLYLSTEERVQLRKLIAAEQEICDQDLKQIAEDVRACNAFMEKQ